MFRFPVVIALVFGVAGSDKCRDDTKGTDYRGCINRGLNGEVCLNWKKVPNNALRDAGLGDHNYCRNPVGMMKRRPWCYYQANARIIEWAYCPVYFEDVGGSNKCFTEPKFDPQCPEYKRTRTAQYKPKKTTEPSNPIPDPEPKPKEEPEKKEEKEPAESSSSSKIQMPMSNSIKLACPLNCSNPTWTPPSPNADGRFIHLVDPLRDTNLRCTCESLNHVFTVCVQRQGPCLQQMDGSYAKEILSNCQNVHIPCEGEPHYFGMGCQGYCGICKTHPLVCGTLIFCTVIVVGLAITTVYLYARSRRNTPPREGGPPAVAPNIFRTTVPHVEEDNTWYDVSRYRHESHYDNALLICPNRSRDSTGTGKPRFIKSQFVASKDDLVMKERGSGDELSLARVPLRKIDGASRSSTTRTWQSTAQSGKDTPFEKYYNTGVPSGKDTMFEKYYNTEVDTWSNTEDTFI